MTPRGMICIPAVLAGLLVVTPALTAPEASANGVALQTFEEGRRLFDQGDFAGALRAFQASLELQPSPNSRLYVARCYRGLGKIASAHAMFRLASREAEDRVAATGEQRYVATRLSATREADALHPLVPRLVLRLDPSSTASAVPDEATLSVDGKPVPRVAWTEPVEVDPGSHVIALEGGRVAPFRSEITIAEREKKEVRVSVRRLATGQLAIRFRARPIGMAATLDGEPLDLSRKDMPRELGAGKHRLEVSAPGYRSFAWEGRVEDGRSVDIPVELELATGRPGNPGGAGTPKWLFFSTAAASLAAAGTGTALFADASSRDAAAQKKPVSERSPAERANIQTEATTSSVLFAAGGALALTAVVLGFTTRWNAADPRDEKRDERRGAARAPGVALVPWGAGMGLDGSF